jgi:ABC-type transport system involved in multi-copper enzyme maturation permease subunit
MIAAFLAEWVLLGRRRFLLGTVAATGAVAALGTVLTFLTERPPAVEGGPVHAGSLADPSGLVQGLQQVSILLGVVSLCVTAAALAGDYAYGTLRNQLMAQPHRLRLLAGKCLALATFVVGLVAAAALGNAALSFAFAPVKGTPTDAWLTTRGLVALAQGVTNAALCGVGFGVLGAVMAVVFRSPAAAISVGVGYALPVEIITTSVWGPAGQWLPAQLLQTLASGGSGYSIAYSAAGTRLLGYGAIAVLVIAILFRRRDVTA